MVIMLRKSIVAEVTAVSLVLLLAACSADQRHKRQVSGDEAYLDTPELRALKAPVGITLPLANSDFDVPATPLTGAVGKQLDIRPPVRPLALLNGSRTEYSNGVSRLLIENNATHRNLWLQVVQAVSDNNISVASRQDVNQTLITDWVRWPRADEDSPFEGRYQISVQPQGYQSALIVKSLGLQQAGMAVIDNSELQRYNNTMLNTISNALEELRADSEHSQMVGSRAGTLDVQTGSDETGLPMLIVRTTYRTFWERLPAALKAAGMKVTDSSRPQGTVAVSYTPLDNADWGALGAKNPGLKAGDYKLQVGDLDNRSSLQFIDPKGHTLTQSQNDALVAVFQAALNQDDIKVK